jgi:hypothetical protein
LPEAFMTLETVAIETPASFATSWMVAADSVITTYRFEYLRMSK